MDTRDVQIINLPTHCNDGRGTLVAIEGEGVCPFEIKRVFFIYGVQYHILRGGHANKTCHELLVMVNGAATVDVSNGLYLLNGREQGLYIPPGNRVDIFGWTEDAVMMVLASEHFDEKDKIYDENDAD